MKPNLKIVHRAVAAALLLTAIVTCAPAQSADDGPPGCESAAGHEQTRCEGETAAHDNVAVVMEALGRPAQFGEARLPLAQIREDLGYLQAVTDYLSQAASQSGELNFKAIARSASEIRKRAVRLKGSLALPDREKSVGRVEEAAPADSGQLRAALTALSAQISDAVDNPALRGHVLDITGSVKARSELEKIVLLSGRIKTTSETLGKARQ